MREKTFKTPTVAEIVEWLLAQDQAAKFCIEDADTNWTIDTFPARTEDGIVWFGPAEYYDMTHE